jgi:hypothetical protein
MKKKFIFTVAVCCFLGIIFMPVFGLFGASDSFILNPSSLNLTCKDDAQAQNYLITYSNSNTSNALKSIVSKTSGDITKLYIKILSINTTLAANRSGTLSLNIGANPGTEPKTYTGTIDLTGVVVNTNSKISAVIPVSIIVPPRPGIATDSFTASGKKLMQTVKVAKEFKIELTVKNIGNQATGDFTVALTGLPSNWTLNSSTALTQNIKSLKKYGDKNKVIWIIVPQTKEVANISMNYSFSPNSTASLRVESK